MSTKFHHKGKLFKYPDRDSNPDLKIRSLAFYSVKLSGHLFVLGEGFKPTNISRYTRFVDEGGHSVTLYPSINWTVVDSIPTSYNLQLYINIFTKFIALLLISYCLYISVLLNRFSPQCFGPPLLSFATHGEQDSNPRCSFEYSFGDCRLRPLGHLRK